MDTINTKPITIGISRATHDRLKSIMKYGQTFDSKISELVTMEEASTQ